MNKGDLVTTLFRVGHPLVGSETKYDTSLTSKSFCDLAKEILCEHGQLGIDCFDIILRSRESWSCICGCINLSLKKSWNIS